MFIFPLIVCKGATIMQKNLMFVWELPPINHLQALGPVNMHTILLFVETTVWQENLTTTEFLEVSTAKKAHLEIIVHAAYILKLDDTYL